MNTIAPNLRQSHGFSGSWAPPTDTPPFPLCPQPAHRLQGASWDADLDVPDGGHTLRLHSIRVMWSLADGTENTWFWVGVHRDWKESVVENIAADTCWGGGRSGHWSIHSHISHDAMTFDGQRGHTHTRTKLCIFLSCFSHYKRNMTMYTHTHTHTHTHRHTHRHTHKHTHM